ncbi:MAG TPA: hypothetical protein VFL29_13090 [Candidatus Dormibacteraeota bacterium]|nr:hypothetical protein [Candidatus Dormibacteraeota bacterium]
MSQQLAPAYYATTKTGWWRDVVALLHPPYTAWHLSYVVIGASLAQHLDLVRLAATVVAFFFAVGISAHALDELHGRPLRTSIPSSVLTAAAAIGLVVAVGLGLAGVTRVGAGLLAFIALGVLFVLVYNLELLGGRLHGDVWFSLSWGAFPLVTGYFAQTGRLSLGVLLVAAAAYALSYGQRSLSTPARLLRRRSSAVAGSVTLTDGTLIDLDQRALLKPLELALRAFSWGVVALAIGMAVERLL